MSFANIICKFLNTVTHVQSQVPCYNESAVIKGMQKVAKKWFVGGPSVWILTYSMEEGPQMELALLKLQVSSNTLNTCKSFLRQFTAHKS